MAVLCKYDTCLKRMLLGYSIRCLTASCQLGVFADCQVVLYYPPAHVRAGTGQSPYGLNWGNGFITEKDVIKKNGLSDPTTFFKRLTKKPYAKSVGQAVAPWGHCHWCHAQLTSPQFTSVQFSSAQLSSPRLSSAQIYCNACTPKLG